MKGRKKALCSYPKEKGLSHFKAKPLILCVAQGGIEPPTSGL